MDQRIQFIAAVKEEPRGNFTQLCKRFGISRAKGYKWLERYRALGAGSHDAMRSGSPLSERSTTRPRSRFQRQVPSFRRNRFTHS